VSKALCGGKVVRVDIRSFEDVRGVLCPIEFDALGFRPARAFVVSGPAGAIRGGHGHRKGRQILMLVSGLIDVELRASGLAERLRLDASCRAILIEPEVWARQIYRSDNAAMVVFCDAAYDPDDYFLDTHAAGALAERREP
jgi:dTDP-4-dehydrorhamnose 3,5-epimerase-like enzyme